MKKSALIILILLTGIYMVGCAAAGGTEVDNGNPANAPEQTEEAAMESAEGVFVGMADNHTVEIMVDDEARAFGLGEGGVAVKDLESKDGISFYNYRDNPPGQNFTVVKLQTGDRVSFDYKENENGRLCVYRLQKTDDGENAEKENNSSGDNENTGSSAGETRSAEGIFTGRIDSHSVEIKIDGSHQAFGLSSELRDKEIAPGDISFQYYVDENGRAVITEIMDYEKPREGDIHTAQGVFSGLADNHTVEIIIDGEARAFGIEEGVPLQYFEEGEDIFICYQEAEYGRLVIVKVEKVF